MKVPDIPNNQSKVQLARLSHVYFEHPDLGVFHKFALDWGFVEAGRVGNTIYYAGYGIDQYVYVATESKDGKARFNGGAFVAKSKADFDKAAKLPGASTKSLDKAPGGGELVTITRPNNTFFHVVFGQKDRKVNTTKPPVPTHDEHGPYNGPFEKPRLGLPQRYHLGPSLVHKLGHFGYNTKEFDEEVQFFFSNFNFRPSDILHHPMNQEMDVMVFLRLDLGKEHADHHCLFFARSDPELDETFVHHTSYEVSDLDTQLLGHKYLKEQGYRSAWGVGRHILGSQIFDYWLDPSGFKVEHYVDGDVFNDEEPPHHSPMGPMSIWGPDLPKDFPSNTVDIEFRSTNDTVGIKA